MSPYTNVFGRRWRTKDGTMQGVLLPGASVPLEARTRGLLWYFPSDAETLEERKAELAAVLKRADEAARTSAPWWRRMLFGY